MKKLILVFTALGATLSGAVAQWKTTTEPAAFYPSVGVESIDGLLYATTNNGIYSSSDNGESWQTLKSSGTYKHILKTSGDTLIATHHGGSSVEISYDKGTTWHYDTVGIGMKGENRTIYYHAPTNQLFLSLGYPSYGLYYKTPSEASWNKVNSTTVAKDSWTNIYHLAVKGSKIYAVSYKYLYESSDNGQTWNQITTTGFPNTVDPAHSKSPFMIENGNMYLTGEGGFYKSIDDGGNWTKTGNGIINLYWNNPFPSAMFADGTTLYVGCRGHNDSNFVYKSTDDGANWVMYQDRLESWPIAFTKHKGAIFLTRFNQAKIYHDSNFTSTALNETQNHFRYEVYPTPTSDNITVKFPSELNVNIKLFNITGKKVTDVNNRGQYADIDVRELSNGVYFLQVEMNGHSQIKKVIVSH